MTQLSRPAGHVIGSACATRPAARHRRQPHARRFRADITNLLFEPKATALMAITAATAQTFNPLPARPGPACPKTARSVDTAFDMRIEAVGKWQVLKPASTSQVRCRDAEIRCIPRRAVVRDVDALTVNTNCDAAFGVLLRNCSVAGAALVRCAIGSRSGGFYKRRALLQVGKKRQT
jgi:hypothetical protein